MLDGMARFGCCGLLMISICLGSLVRLQTTSFAQPPTLDQIAGSIRAVEQAIFRDSESFRIVYALDKSEDITRTKLSGGLFLTEWCIAKNGANGWYSEIQYWQKSGNDFPLPQQPVTSISKDGLALDWRHQGDCIVTAATNNVNCFHGWQYVRHLGLDAYRRIARSWNVSDEEEHLKDLVLGTAVHDELEEPYLPDSLEKNHSDYRVHPEPELVDDNRCWVVEWTGMDKFWVDLKHGCSVRRRIVHWGPGRPRKYEVLNRDFREVRPGLWLPHQQVVDQYAKIKVEVKELWGRIANRSTYNVRAIKFDENLDELFVVRLPAGTFVEDLARDTRYRVAREGEDPFEESIEHGRRHSPSLSGARLWTMPVARAPCGDGAPGGLKSCPGGSTYQTRGTLPYS